MGVALRPAASPAAGDAAPFAASSAGPGTTWRKVLHVDMNCFYASVEQHRDPSIRGLPVAVVGDPAKRSGIVLAKSRAAKAYGVKTAEPIWQAKQKCPQLILVPPDYEAYKRYSRLARSIYYDYTDLVEPFGLDECWMDVTGSLSLHGGSEMLVAQEISERIKAELGLTVSVGLSWNKVFAKFGSDTDSGDGIAHITPENYREVVWPQPAEELLWIGPATKRKLNAIGIVTIGDVARAEPQLMRNLLGKMGLVIHSFANGLDDSPVKPLGLATYDTERSEIKSIGNGLTAPHDIVDAGSAKALIWLLSESVAQRLRAHGFRARTVAISIRSASDLGYCTRQCALPFPSCLTGEIAEAAFSLLEAEFCGREISVRALDVRATSLIPSSIPIQLDLFGAEGVQERRCKLEALDNAIDTLRARFGNKCVMRMVELSDESMADVDIERTNTVHPIGYFGG